MSLPIARVDDFGAKGDGVTDDTAAITAAIHSLGDGGTVVLSPGKTYLKRKVIRVDRPDVKIWGYGATVYAMVTDADVEAGVGAAQISIMLLAPRTALYGLTVISNLRTRLIGYPHNSAAYVESEGAEVVDNRFEYTGNGVLLFNAKEFLVARNVVYRTTADGIHVTNGSSNGRILCNVVRQTGDDMIAVVNYGIGEPTIGNFLIEGNDVADQYSGRGIAVVGGRDVTIRKNVIARTPHGAAILVNSETGWETANVDNVLVEENQITDVQTTRPSYNPLENDVKTGHGAIDINGQGSQQVTNVLLRHNHTERVYRDGALVRGNTCNVGFERNDFESVGRDAIRIESNLGPGCRVSCTDNSLDGAPAFDTQCSSTPVSASGASQLVRLPIEQ